MIRASAGDVVLLGLSEINMQRLREGKPIKVDLYDIGFSNITPRHVVLFYGATEDAMKERLADLFGPDTRVEDRRPKQ